MMVSAVTGKFLISSEGVKRNCGVIIEDGKISQINPNSKIRNKVDKKNIIEGTNKIIAPGFINAHVHMYNILARGVEAPEGINDFEGFLKDFWWPKIEDKLTPELIEKAVRFSALEQINSGIVAVSDILEAPDALPNVLRKEAEIVEDLGLKAVISFEASERAGKQKADLALEENRNFTRYYQDNPFISGRQCLHTTFTCSKDFIKKAFKYAREQQNGMQLHLSEGEYEVKQSLKNHDMRPVELYEELGVLGEDLLVSQAVKVNKNERKLLQKNNVKVAHVPLSNCEVGGGIAPIPEMIDQGITVALGTDGFINNFFETMRGAFLIHKGFKEDPSVMPACRVFSLATENGSKALGIGNNGIIKPGKKADIITIATDSATPITKENLYEQLIIYHNPRNVKEVFIEGNLLKRDGQLLCGNLEEARNNAIEAAEQLWRED